LSVLKAPQDHAKDLPVLQVEIDSTCTATSLFRRSFETIAAGNYAAHFFDQKPKKIRPGGEFDARDAPMRPFSPMGDSG